MNSPDLTTLTLAKGPHASPDRGLSLLEAVALFAGEGHTDSPRCVSKVLTAFGNRLNDALPDGRRQQLKPLIPRLVGTRDDGLDETRSYMALDWLARTCASAWLDLAGLTDEATALRDLRRIVDMAAAEAVGPVLRDVQARAAAAWAAAKDAAWADWGPDGAGDAAWAAVAVARAARDAATAAGVVGAAWVAAADAEVAATAAVGVAAADGAALAQTVDRLQQSAIELYAAMI